MQWQILSKDDRAADFYGRMFGGPSIAPTPATARAHRRRPRHRRRHRPSPPEGHAFVQLFVEVDDVAAAAQRWTELGGRLIVPPTELPDGDALCIAQDPEGIPMGLYRAKA
jgi:predicted enzyme related to lactoylglutathione lyase